MVTVRFLSLLLKLDTTLKPKQKVQNYQWGTRWIHTAARGGCGLSNHRKTPWPNCSITKPSHISIHQCATAENISDQTKYWAWHIHYANSYLVLAVSWTSLYNSSLRVFFSFPDLRAYTGVILHLSIFFDHKVDRQYGCWIHLTSSLSSAFRPASSPECGLRRAPVLPAPDCSAVAAHSMICRPGDCLGDDFCRQSQVSLSSQECCSASWNPSCNFWSCSLDGSPSIRWNRYVWHFRIQQLFTEHSSSCIYID